jgi:hypothetical protein
MNNTITTSENMRTGLGLAVIREPRRSDDLRREDRQSAGSHNGLPAHLVPFDGDEVAIGSQAGTAVRAAWEQLPVYAAPSGSAGAVAETKDRPDQGLAVRDAGVVPYSVGISPRDAHANTIAMKKYGEASSYRSWRSGTFEVTV